MVKAILLGAGDRGANAYAPYALKNPDEIKFVALAEPIKERREAFQIRYNLPLDCVFEDYKENSNITADCVFVCTQDQMHYEPVMLALDKGYHVLCEKPMSGSITECNDMVKKAKECNRVLAVCHVLRYTPFFQTVRKLIDDGTVGRVLSMNLIENVAFCHYAHSFVRGNWRNHLLSNPMILAKSCHDMDMLQSLAKSKCKRISSNGSLSYFKAENAPEGAPKYCLEGCSAADTCPFNAERLYLTDNPLTNNNFRQIVSTEPDDEKFRAILKTSPYGRCVFQCDNDVVDNQVVSIEFENGITASFSMEACTGKWGRVLNIFGTKAQLIADTDDMSITLYDFLTFSKKVVKIPALDSGHFGGDDAIVKDFIAVIKGEKEALTSAYESLESHLMALGAEKSRLEKKVIEIDSLRC